MKINYPSDNPFKRQHLINQPKSLYASTITLPKNDHTYDNYIYHSRAQHYPLNIWSFRDDHNNSFMPITQTRNFTQISSFEKSMMVGGTTSRKNNSYTYQNYVNSKPQLKYKALDQNPFQRKNLLISRAQIEEQIEKDRNRINYQNWAQNHEGSKRNSRRQSSYGNPQEKYNYSVNQISNNGSMMMNLLDKPALQGHLLGTMLGQNYLSKASSSKQRQSSQKRQPQSAKQQVTIRSKKFYKAKVIKI